jgi:hypothetical protein
MPWLQRNICGRGRLLRAGTGLALLGAAGLLAARDVPGWLVLAVAASGLFALFEAAAGWCVARACGIKTRI